MLALDGQAAPHSAFMWHEPYLETCCRASLHRVVLAGALGRPDGLKDGPCLHRLAAMGLVRCRADARFELTDRGRARHASEILKRPAPINGGVETAPPAP